MRTVSEYYRLQRIGYGNTTGLLFWSLDDQWQGQSDSSVDYIGRWKLLQYTLKSSIFAPQLIVLSQYYMDGTAPASDLIVGLVNDIGEPIEGKLELSVMGWHGGGEPLETYDLGKIAVPGYSSVNATTLPLAKILGADMEGEEL